MAECLKDNGGFILRYYFVSFEFFQLNLNRHFKWFISTSHGKIMPICNKNGNNEKLRTWFYLCFFKETK